MSTDLVQKHSDKIVTTSIKVAEVFSKQHKNVMQAIENLLQDQVVANRLNFKLVDYIDAKGENRPMYEMDRDGFTLLAMGFTGKKALAWKVKYIDAFNQMEKALVDQIPQLPQSFAEALQLAANIEKERAQLAEQNAFLVPKAAIADHLVASEDATNLTVAAKIFGISPHRFNTELHRMGWIYRSRGSWVGYESKVKAGYLDVKYHTYRKENGEVGTTPQVLVLPRGLAKLTSIYGKQECLELI